MFRKYPLSSRLTLFVVVPVLAIVGSAWWHLRQSLPVQQGQLALPKVIDTVQVERDAEGVPHIAARNDHDAFFAMGFVHAQDRMWQLELQRRIASGRLSEVFGKGSVEQDIWFRTLGLDRSTRVAWTTLSPGAQASLQAYTDGINSWLASKPVLPVEFAILDITPQPWTVYDSLAWVKVLALNLGGNYRREMERMLVSQVIDPAKLQVLFPEYPQQAATTVVALDQRQQDALQRFAEFQQTLESQLQIGGRYVGSNAWVVSGKLAGGAALMANDPHLGLQIPSLWYMASIKGDKLDVYGATLVGLPMVIFGRNQAISWGGTNLMADAQDIYFEQAKPDDNTQYNANGTWTAFDVREELIEVKQDFPQFLRNALKPVRIQVRSSRHGPLISDMFQVFDQPAALRWTALDADDTSYDAFYHLNYAQDWATFQAALRHLVAPAMNVLYADRSGNIGYLGAGRMPIRAAGEGMVPVAGWNNEHEWTGAIPFEQWPRSYNPDSGYLVSANNKPVGADYPYLISHDWAPAARAERITELLAQASKSGTALNLEAMRRIQADTHSEPARKVLALLLAHEPTSEQQTQAMAVLRTWQGDMRSDSPAATIFNAWIRVLRYKLLLDDVKGYWNKPRASRYMRSVAGGIDLDSLHAVLSDTSGRWCDDLETADHVEICDETLDEALDSALIEVQKITGNGSMNQWAWGDVHQTLYSHTPFSQVNFLRSFFERRIGNGGSPDSVNVATYVLDKSGYAQDFGAGFRQLVALSAQHTEHLYMNSTGQSGNVMSPHYDDMVERFRDVDYVSLTATRASGGEVLTLVPAQAGATQGGAP